MNDLRERLAFPRGETRRPFRPPAKGAVHSVTRKRAPEELGRTWTPEQMASVYEDPWAAAWMLHAVEEWEARRCP